MSSGAWLPGVTDWHPGPGVGGERQVSGLGLYVKGMGYIHDSIAVTAWLAHDLMHWLGGEATPMW